MNSLNDLQEQAENLKNENLILQKQLAKLNEKLRESEAFKGHFISNITNEIVNPFTSILGLSKGIISLNEKQIGQIHSMAHLVFNEAFDLDFQLQNIFAAAKIESGEVNLELSSICPLEVIVDIIESLRFKSEKKNQYISVDIPVELPYNLVTDLNKYQLIIKNVITNAIIFGHEKTAINVQIKALNDGIQVTINNKGNLIEPEEINQIFDRFVKLDKTINSINQGHGLGLSVTKAYLELLGGDIRVESNQEKGNTFQLFIPPSSFTNHALIREDDLFIDDTEIF
jgi:signal transduction histidine kinase